MLLGFGNNSEVEINKLEKDNKIELPKDYKDFLINCNGANTGANIVCFKAVKLEEDIPLGILYGIGLSRGLNIQEWNNEYKEELPKRTLIIGHAMGSGTILLIHNRIRKGIFFWDNCLDYPSSTARNCLYKVCGSFQEFIELLTIVED